MMLIFLVLWWSYIYQSNTSSLQILSIVFKQESSIAPLSQTFPTQYSVSSLLKIWDKEKVEEIQNFGDGKSRLSKEITYSSERIRIRSNKFSFVWTNNIFVQTNNYSSFVYRSKHILILYRKRRLCRSFFHQYLILHSCLLVCLRFAHIWKSCLEKKLWNLRENTQTEKNELNLSKKKTIYLKNCVYVDDEWMGLVWSVWSKRLIK